MSNFTDFALQQDVMSFKEKLESAIADKVGDALAQKKLEVAQTFFDVPETETAEVAEEVEQIDEFVDRETRLAARKAETGSSTRVSSGDVLGRRGGHETPKHAIARRVGKDSYGIRSGGKTSIYNRLPKPNLPEEAEQTNEKALNPYAVGMAQAMKSTGDKPPLKKATIKKAHEIAKSVAKK